MSKAYKYSIIYFLLFGILLLLSGVMLFEHKIGFSIEGVLDYYMGNQESFIVQKSAGGILKIVLPHIFAFGLFSMVILHFLVFTAQRGKTETKVIIYLTFLSAFLEIASPFMIISGVKFFAYIKIVSFFLFFFLILYTSWLLFKSIIHE